MKRLPILAAALALLAASCSQTDMDKPRIGLAMRSFDEAASTVIRGTMEIEALDRAELSIIDGRNQRSAQDLQTDSLFEKKLGAIAIDPVDEASLGPLIEKAKSSRVPLVFFGIEPPGEYMRSWDKLFYVGTGSAEAGAAQGEILASYWKANAAADRNKDGSLEYILLPAAPGGQVPGAQAEAVAAALEAAGIPGVALAAEVEDGQIATARQLAAALLAKYGERVEAFVCADDETALESIDALKAAGYFKGKKRLPVVGSGEGEPSDPVAAALASGTLLGSAHTDPASQAKAVFDLAFTLARGSAPWKSGWKITDAKYVWVPCRKIAKDEPAPKK